MKIGDIYSIPITLFHDTEPNGSLGLAKVLAFDGESWFAAALDDFVTDESKHTLSAPILSLRKVDAFPYRKGHLFSRGQMPETWRFISNANLSEEENEYAHLYMTWQDPNASMFDSQTAYEKFGGASEGLESIDNGLAFEWRFRFDLEKVLAEKAARDLRMAEAAPPKKPTWAEVSKKTFSSGTPELQKFVQPFYEKLIDELQNKRTKAIAKAALTRFFRQANQHYLSGEYRDEIASVGADVGSVCGLKPDEVYKIAENAN